MGLLYTYQPLRTVGYRQSGKNRVLRHRPILPVWVTGPAGTLPINGCIDSGCDNCIFPKYLADHLDIDLANAPKATSRPVGSKPLTYRSVHVTLRICDGNEECKWDTTVGFIDKPMHWALLGHAGFLDFFTTELHGDAHQTVLTPNTNFPGRHTVFQAP